MIPTLETNIAGLPERPKEVVAKDTDEIPVRFAPLPLNEVAVITPVILIPDEFMVTAVAPSPEMATLVGVILPEATFARLTPLANT